MQVLLKNLQCAQLLFLILDNRLGRDHLLRHTGRNQNEILLADFHTTLLGVELADSHAVARLLQIELFGLTLCEFDHVEPSHCRSIFAMGFQHLRRSVEQTLESLDQDRTERACAQISSDALVPV